MPAACTVDSTHKANQAVVYTPNGNQQAIPANGGYWDQGFDLGIGRNNSFMDDDWADDYSKTSVCNGNLVDDSHFALYYNGTLLQEWTSAVSKDPNMGAEPCCQGTAKVSSMSLAKDREEPTATPTPTGKTENLRVTAEPNVSRGGEPVKFIVSLDKPSRVQLSLFAVSGEEVYQKEAQENRGTNTLVWKLDNQSGQAVASGIYIFVLRVDDGNQVDVKTGKVAVLR